jgi:hypothetical protein
MCHMPDTLGDLLYEKCFIQLRYILHPKNASICCVHKASKSCKVDQDSSEQNTAIYKNLRTVKIVETHSSKNTILIET